MVSNKVKAFKEDRFLEYKKLSAYYYVFEDEMKKFVKHELQYEQLMGE
jgi:hypothetical protein